MARLFDDASTEYLGNVGAVVLAEPMTLAGWFYSDLDGGQTIVSVGDSAGTHYFGLQLRGQDGGDPVVAKSFGSANVHASSTSGYSVNTWHHGVAVFAANDDRAAFIDGGNKGTESTASTVSTPDASSIGVSADSTPYGYFSGRIAEVGVWDAALTDVEVAILAAGYSPLFVRPQNLVAYWPLIRDEDQDRVGGYHLTAYNTPSIATHPPVIYPASVLSYSISLPVSGIEIFRRRREMVEAF